jgi:uroporphyrinogen-III synthase
MAVLLTRPSPDNEASSEALRARGFDVLLAPMLRFEPAPFTDEADADYQAVIVTSANALRAVAGALAQSRLRKLPLFAVGEHTASVARDIGFAKVITAKGDAAALRDRVLESVRAKELKKRPLLYLAGADLSRDLASDLGQHGLEVATQATYRMAALASLPRAVCDAFARDEVDAVLHYSRRSAAAFLEAVRNEGIEISALSVPQCCISANAAGVLHEAGAAQVKVAASPDEKALFEALERALPSRLA